MAQLHDQRRVFLPSLLNKRCDGTIRRRGFRSGVAALRVHFQLLESPQVASSHTGSISSLDIAEGRFLLAAGEDSTVSIYDLSTWGTENHLTGTSGTRPNHMIHKPVAKSIRVPSLTNEVQLPTGHSHSIISAQWYPVDTGAFVSASADASLLVWDTNAMTPVARFHPFDLCRCFHMSQRSGVSQSLVAVGSEDEPVIKLVDLRSGAASHTLVAHKQGITTVQWSPACDVVLSSGSTDGCIALWDIRKSGSNAFTTFLDRDATFNDENNYGQYVSSYKHLRKKPKQNTINPSNYREVQSTSVQSHGGGISSLSFCPDGHFLVSTGRDGNLHHWDLRSGHLVPTHYFLARSHQPAVRKIKKVPLIVTQLSPIETMAWVGHGENILGYSLEKGGKPTQTLEGHLANVTSVTATAIDEVPSLISGGRDGMILVWGCPTPSSRRHSPSGAGKNIGSKRGREEEVSQDRDFW